jgi:hypothetical protein
LLDHVDRAVEVVVILLELGKGKADGIAVDRKLGRYALGDRELEPGEEIGGNEAVGGGVRADCEGIAEKPLGFGRLICQKKQPGEAVGGEPKVGGARLRRA